MKNKDYRFYKKILKNIDLITGGDKKLEEKIWIGSLEAMLAMAKWNQKDLIISKEIIKRLNRLGYNLEVEK